MRKRYRLSAVLAGCNLRHDLRCYRAGGSETLRRIDSGSGDAGTVLQHVFEVNQAAVGVVLRKIIRVMEMNDSFLMRFTDIVRQQILIGKIPAPLSRDIIPLYRQDRRVFIRVFLLDLFVSRVNDSLNLLIQRVHFPVFVVAVTVSDIVSCKRKLTACH